jgi:hypothetical protein
VNGIDEMARGSNSHFVTRATNRGSDTLILLSTLIDRTDRGSPYLYGAVMLDTFSAVIPRALWPDKPVVVPPQRLIRRGFGLQDQDDTAGPLIAYFAFAGPWGIFAWLFIFGFVVGRLSIWASHSNGILPWFLLFWVLGSALFIEQDQTMGIVIAVRHCILAWFLYHLILFFHPKERAVSPRRRKVRYPRLGVSR